MSEIRTLTCNCGCKATTNDPKQSGWFKLDQFKSGASHRNKPKLEGELHFKALKCLAKWSQKASTIGKSLEKSAGEVEYVRGNYVDEGMPELYV